MINVTREGIQNTYTRSLPSLMPHLQFLRQGLVMFSRQVWVSCSSNLTFPSSEITVEAPCTQWNTLLFNVPPTFKVEILSEFHFSQVYFKLSYKYVLIISYISIYVKVKMYILKFCTIVNKEITLYTTYAQLLTNYFSIFSHNF